MNKMTDDRSIMCSHISQCVCALLVGMAFCLPVSGQTLTVRLLDAKSARPMGGYYVRVHWIGEFEESHVWIGRDGVGHVKVPIGAKGFGMRPGPKVGNEPNRIPYINCNNSASHQGFQVADALRRGIVPGNECGKQGLDARPGEVVFWALPLPKGLDMQ